MVAGGWGRGVGVRKGQRVRKREKASGQHDAQWRGQSLTEPLSPLSTSPVHLLSS